MERDLAAPQSLDARLINIDTGDVVAEIGEPRTRDEADVSGADHC
jgi:hypothetical protein